MNTKIIPLGDRVLVKPFTEADLKKRAGEKSKLNFVLPDSVKEEKSAQGKVVAVGETKKLKVGDTVIFSKYAYDEVKHGGEELYLIKEENVFAIIK
jgi:chaperonin GroES